MIMKAYISRNWIFPGGCCCYCAGGSLGKNDNDDRANGGTEGLTPAVRLPTDFSKGEEKGQRFLVQDFKVKFSFRLCECHLLFS